MRRAEVLRHSLSVGTVLIVSWLCGGSTVTQAVGQVQSAEVARCATPREPEPLLADARRFASADDRDSRLFRLMNKLPVLPTSSVFLVQDQAVCQRAARAYQAWHLRGGGDPYEIKPVMVAQIEDIYLVDDGRPRVGPSAIWAVLIFDHDFKERSGHYGSGY